MPPDDAGFSEGDLREGDFSLPFSGLLEDCFSEWGILLEINFLDDTLAQNISNTRFDVP